MTNFVSICSRVSILQEVKISIFPIGNWRRRYNSAAALLVINPGISASRVQRVNEKSKFCKFKMVDGRHIENCFLATSRRHIGWSMRNLEHKLRITWRYRSRDQNCNFLKFKMADGRHFENSFISISQPRIIWFRSNMVHRYKFPFRAWKFDKII